MKIAYLSFATLPSRAAHGVNIIKMCEALTEIGHDVTLYTDSREPAQDIMDLYAVEHPFAVKRIRLVKIRVLGRLVSLLKTASAVRRSPPDLLYTRDVFTGRLAAKLHIPFVFELHEIHPSDLRDSLFRKLISSTRCKRLIYISYRMKQLAEEKYGSAVTTLDSKVAHDAADIKLYDSSPGPAALRRELNLPEGTFIVGYTGSLFPGRGMEIILHAAQSLPDVTFLIVGGEGRYFSEFKEKVDKSGGNVLFKGFIPYKNVPRHLLACDVLLMPYQRKVLHRQKKHDTAEYMSPLKMFEYMAAGKAIISSRIPVLEEILHNEENALLVAPDNKQEWIEAISRLKDHPDLAAKLGHNASRDVQDHSWRSRAERIMEKINIKQD